jgi:hypothetical protein
LLTVTVFPETTGVPETVEWVRLTCWAPATVVAAGPEKVVPWGWLATVVPVGYTVVKLASAPVADTPSIVVDVTR